MGTKQSAARNRRGRSRGIRKDGAKWRRLDTRNCSPRCGASQHGSVAGERRRRRRPEAVGRRVRGPRLSHGDERRGRGYGTTRGAAPALLGHGPGRSARLAAAHDCRPSIGSRAARRAELATHSADTAPRGRRAGFPPATPRGPWRDAGPAGGRSTSRAPCTTPPRTSLALTPLRVPRRPCRPLPLAVEARIQRLAAQEGPRGRCPRRLKAWLQSYAINCKKMIVHVIFTTS